MNEAIRHGWAGPGHGGGGQTGGRARLPLRRSEFEYSESSKRDHPRPLFRFLLVFFKQTSIQF